MKNNQLLPFERNRYYAGKMLTSTDFTAEQLYMNNKRRFLNNVLYGSGIVCGLNVFSLDDLSILVESGVAIDDLGQEIVVDSSVVRKLSVIEGYDNLKSDRAILGIRYKEDKVHPVYCSEKQDCEEEYEYNRIDERYELFLQDAQTVNDPFAGTDDFISKQKILDHEDYLIYLGIPGSIPKGKAVKMQVSIYKRTAEHKSLAFHTVMQLPAFSDEEGKRELEIDIPELYMQKGEIMQKEFWIKTELTDANETNMIAKKENTRITIDGYDIEAGHDINFKVMLVNLSPYELATWEVSKPGLETNKIFAGVSFVQLAEIQMIRTDAAYLIGSVREQGVKRYIVSPGKADQRHKYLSFFKTIRQDTEKKEQLSQNNMDSVIPDMLTPNMIASGRVEIPLDVNMKKGDICYSEEIMHGLGKGNVYVDVGIEYIEDSLYAQHPMRNTIYGDSDLFAQEECMQIQTAVKVMNDKGSFQIAAKLLGEQRSIVLQLNWVAIKYTGIKDASEIQEEDNRCIIPDTPTVRLKAKESYFFNVTFQNMKPCRLSYELTESGSGEIGTDGIYTAPAKEGVYEIYIYCTDMPKISTYVYAIVNK